jgi:hypothetical protein
MYADDLFSPTQSNDYDNVNIGAIRKTVKSIQEMDNFKKNYYTITKPFNDMIKGKFYKTVNISYYGSGISGSKIRNAIDGQYTNYIVGRSKDESNFFKVTMACGMQPDGPINLFYNSPEEYERHQIVELDQATKDKWFNKKIAV